MKKSLYIIIGVAMLLFASCGQQQQAEEIIKEFLDANAADPSALSSIAIVKFDSTRVIADSVIVSMREKADTIQRYKQSIQYTDGTNSKKLFVARISYTIDTAEYSDTYYLDEQLSRVIAFKSN